MQQFLSLVSLVVKDYDEAIDFYTRKLQFTLTSDQPLPDGKRWVTIAPPGAKETGLLLARAANEEQMSRVGNQAGGRVSFFLHTDDFSRDYRQMVDVGIHFVQHPRHEPYGTVAVFEDLYGNLWDLIQPAVIASR